MMFPTRSLILLFLAIPLCAQTPRLTLRPNAPRQTMAGFGVNFNGTYFRDSQKKAVDLLIDDLGATMFRFDPYGLTNWETLNDNDRADVMNWSYYNDRYSTPTFEASWAAARYLNSRGIRPILNLSGIAPDWMLDKAPGKEKADHLKTSMHEEFAETAVSLAAYARFKARVDFDLFGPVNETDCPPREGPGVTPAEMPDMLTAIVKRLKSEGLTDIKLVVADQCNQKNDYMGPILAREELLPWLAAASYHTYGPMDLTLQMRQIEQSKDPHLPLWLTEYGDLKDEDFSPENEWSNFCIKATRRALDAINTGASAALWWDAYDNFHEHDQRMTYYGLLSNRDHIYSPKKRFYAARQLFRYVRPGAVRIDVEGAAKGLTVSAFRDASSFVIVGVKDGGADAIEIAVHDGTTWDLYQTTREVNGLKAATLSPKQGVLSVRLPAEAVFTLVGKEAK